MGAYLTPVSTAADTSRVGSVDVLFILAYSEAARDHLAVFQELQRRGFTCALGLIARNPATEAVIAEAGVSPFLWPGEDGQCSPGAHAKRTEIEGAVHASGVFKRAARAALIGSTVFEAVQEFRSQLRDRRQSRRFFAPGRCRALVLEADTSPPSLHFAGAARRVRIPSVVIQSHLIPDDGSIFLGRRIMPTQHWRPTGAGGLPH